VQGQNKERDEQLEKKNTLVEHSDIKNKEVHEDLFVSVRNKCTQLDVILC
jgi:hypothetical protein